jgi:hypothetical protein
VPDTDIAIDSLASEWEGLELGEIDGEEETERDPESVLPEPDLLGDGLVESEAKEADTLELLLCISVESGVGDLLGVRVVVRVN